MDVTSIISYLQHIRPMKGGNTLGIWVNPEFPDDFRVRELPLGHYYKEFVFLGTFNLAAELSAKYGAEGFLQRVLKNYREK